jgi:hypothetical protein
MFAEKKICVNQREKIQKKQFTQIFADGNTQMDAEKKSA